MQKILNKLKLFYSNKEYRLVTINILASVCLKFLSMVLSLYNTKLYISFFNNNVVLGGWFAIVTILNWILNFDLGIGNGLRNEIVVPYENKDTLKLKKYISTGYAVLGIISLVIIILGIILSFALNWNKVLNLPSSEVNIIVLRKMMLISFLGVGIQFFLKIINSIYNALRMTLVSGFTALMTNAAVFIYLLVGSSTSTESALIKFAIVYAMSTNIPLVLVTILGFLTLFKSARPSIKLIDKTAAKSITGLGMHFFVIQVALMLVSSTDSWLISYYFSPDLTVDYQVYYRFFSIALTVFVLFSQTTWSSITKYAGEKNDRQIMKAFSFLNSIAILGFICCCAVAVCFKHICKVWMGDTNYNVFIGIAFLFAGWMFMQMLINSSTAIANGLGKLKCQTVFVPIAGISKICMVILFSMLGFEWYFVVVSNILCLVPLEVAQFISIRKELKLMKNRLEE